MIENSNIKTFYSKMEDNDLSDNLKKEIHKNVYFTEKFDNEKVNELIKNRNILIKD